MFETLLDGKSFSLSIFTNKKESCLIMLFDEKKYATNIKNIIYQGHHFKLDKKSQ